MWASSMVVYSTVSYPDAIDEKRKSYFNELLQYIATCVRSRIPTVNYICSVSLY